MHNKVWEGWRGRDIEKHCCLWQTGRRDSSGIFGIHTLYARIHKRKSNETNEYSNNSVKGDGSQNLDLQLIISNLY